MTRGRFITFEGGEGVGKSTQIAAARACVERAGFKVIVTREPGGTKLAEQIRELLLQPAEESMPPLSELLLVFAARAAHLENLILPALDGGSWVICDRFTDATYAYQGGGRGISWQHIAVLEELVQQKFRPDLTLLLDAPIALAMQRAHQRNLARGELQRDRFEREQTEFFERIRLAYQSIAAREPARVKNIDAAQDIASVAAQVEHAVKQFIETLR